DDPPDTGGGRATPCLERVRPVSGVWQDARLNISGWPEDKCLALILDLQVAAHPLDVVLAVIILEPFLLAALVGELRDALGRGLQWTDFGPGEGLDAVENGQAGIDLGQLPGQALLKRFGVRGRPERLAQLFEQRALFGQDRGLAFEQLD